MWAFEHRFIPDDQKQLVGILPQKGVMPTFLGLTALLLGLTFLLSFEHSKWPIFAICPILARLVVLDLRYYLLPNIYVLALLVAGVVATPLLGWLPWWESALGAFLGLTLPLIFTYVGSKLRGEDRFNMGGGDLKFISAAGAWLGVAHLSNYVLLACLFSFAFLSLPKEKPLPFGPGLIVAFFLMIFFKDDVNTLLYKLFSLI